MTIKEEEFNDMKFLSKEHKNEFVRKVQKNKGKLIIHDVIKLLNSGLSQTDIAKHFGVTKQSISKIILKYKKLFLL